MKFTVSQSALAKALSVVSKGMATNSTLPLLSGVNIRAERGVLEFRTTNLTISIRHKIAANVEEPGETVVSGKILANIVKTLPDAAVSFSLEGRSLTISCEKSTFKLNTLDPADFPGFPEFALSESIELPCDELSRMVDRVYRVTSKDNTRPILSGILMTVEAGTIRLVATDSYRLALCEAQVEAPGSFEMIVPGAAFHDVLTLPSDTGRILIGKTDSQVVFVFGNTTYVARKIEGNYPNYRQLLPSSSTTTVNVNVGTLSAALKRVSVISLSNPSIRFDIDAGAGTVRLTATSPDQGEATEVIPAEVDGRSMAIALNYHYVFDCVNVEAADHDMTLELKESMQPGIFRSHSDVEYLYLLMPVRM